VSERREHNSNADGVRLAQIQRDKGLARLSMLTRWSVIGAAVLTGVFATAAARAFPASTHAATSTHAGSSRRTSTGSTAGGSTLQPPAQAPAPATAPSVVSGGS
jgi:hypothetical protein